jgi:hypothetical protein
MHRRGLAIAEGSAAVNHCLRGDLTMRGTTRPITLKAEVEGTERDPWGNERVGLEVTGELDRTDWGTTFNQMLGSGNLLASNRVKLTLASRRSGTRSSFRRTMASRPDRSDGELALDRLPDPAEVVDVLPLEGVSTSPAEAREPHRHTLTRATRSSTKELVTDAVMVEAARLLRFSDLTAGQIAHRVGFSDPLYFSRAFKRHHGESPTGYRARGRGHAKLSA